jgi:hypothetical protein
MPRLDSHSYLHPGELVVEDWSEFFPSIKKARLELGDPDTVWFRGQANADHTLVPSLYRVPDGAKHERSIFQKFRQLSGRLLPQATSDWQTLFDMQHYGVPTRLLDWTPVLGVAVFFAISFRADEDQDCAVFVIDPLGVNKLSGRKSILSPDDKSLSYTEIYWESRPFAPMLPLALEAPFHSDRMLAQRGVFTVHSINPEPVERLCPKSVKKLRLTPACISGAEEFLSYANINDATMFPDIQGLANYLRSLFYLGRLAI